MNDRLDKMSDLLLQLESEMRRLELWASDEPTEHALQSTAPFSADRLALEEWLQWIFIPTIKSIIENDGKLPEKCEIYPYAEEILPPGPDQPSSLLRLIRDIDQFISAG
jgi:uncharacterized protein YqcC (DUF446 family)